MSIKSTLNFLYQTRNKGQRRAIKNGPARITKTINLNLPRSILRTACCNENAVRHVDGRGRVEIKLSFV